MNIAVGKITDAARKAIEKAGGTIKPTQKQGVLMVTFPETAGKYAADSAGAYIDLPGSPVITLRFLRAWDVEDCSLDIHEDPGTTPAIITQRNDDGWIAYIASKRTHWEGGKSEAEAVGNLHLSHANIFGRVIHND